MKPFQIMSQGTRWVLLMQKNRHRKSHAWAPLNRGSVWSFDARVSTQKVFTLTIVSKINKGPTIGISRYIVLPVYVRIQYLIRFG